MRIYTDASLGNTNIAGIAAVLVPENAPISCHHSHCSLQDIDINIAELFAVAFALQIIRGWPLNKVSVFSDSVNTIKTLWRVFENPDKNNIRMIPDSHTKQILYYLSGIFQEKFRTSFSFHFVKGHQHQPPIASDGYYNNVADKQADIGRKNGASNPKITASEINIIYNQQSTRIVRPRKIAFGNIESKLKNLSARATNTYS